MKSSQHYILRLLLSWQRLWGRNKPDGDKNVWDIYRMQVAAMDCIPGVGHILHSEPEEHFSTKLLEKNYIPLKHVSSMNYQV